MTDLISMTDGRTSGGNDSVATYECSDGIVMGLGKMYSLCHDKSPVELKQAIGGREQIFGFSVAGCKEQAAGPDTWYAVPI